MHSSSLRRLTRWLQLVLACVAIAVTAAPAQAQPETDVIALSVRGATRDTKAQRRAEKKPARAHRSSSKRVCKSPATPKKIGAARKARPPHKHRRLYIKHHTLLR